MQKMKWLAIALITAAVAGVMLPAYNIFNLQPAVYRMLIAATEQDTTRIALSISTYAFPEIEGVPQQKPPFGDLVREMFDIKRVFGLVKLTIFSADGQVLFSTSTEEINRINRQTYFVEKVIKGRIHTNVITLPRPSSSHADSKVHVVQTCVPIMRAGQFAGAVEIDYNITGRKMALDNLIHGSSVFLFWVGTLIMTVSVFFGLRSKRAALEQGRAENKLKSAHRQLENIIEFLPDATFVIDREKKVVAWNRAMQEMTNIPKEDILDKGNFDYALAFYGQRRPMLIDLVGKDIVEAQKYYDQVEKQGDTLYAEIALTMKHTDEPTNLWAKASPLIDQDGHFVGAIESIRDISERRTAQKRLSDKKVLLENILNNIPHSVFWKDRNFVYQGCNLNFAKVAGVVVPENIIGKTDFDLAWKQGEAEFYQKCDREVMESGLPLLDIEETQLQADGKNAILLTSKVPLRNKDEQVIGILGIFADITRQRGLEKQLRQSQRIEAVGTLAGGIAHDFNNILTAIIGYTEFAMNDMTSNSKGQFALNEVLNASLRAKDLVKQILTFGQQVEQERSPTSLAPIVSEALKLLRATFPATLEIQQEIDQEAGTVLADPTQIHQVIMNLGTNAYHAMQEKGGVLRVVLDNLQVDAEFAATTSGLQAGPYVRLILSDTGKGMLQETLEHIFEPYFTTKRAGEGTGLGLSVVHGIVRGHNGAISVTSRHKEGTVFTVYLPRLFGDNSQKTIEYEGLPKGREHILFIDDEEVLVNLAQKNLETLGYKVTTALCSQSALKIFRATPYAFDLIFTDQSMPMMNGTQLAREILLIRPELPIVLCTGFINTTSLEKAKLAGVNEFVMKPLTKRDIAVTIRKVLDNKDSLAKNDPSHLIHT